MSKSRALSYATAAALLVTSLSARADDTAAPTLALAGFGTLGVVHSSEPLADTNASRVQPNGAGYTRDWSASVDSLVAAQLTANLTPKLSAVIQVIAEQNYNDSYWPHFEWANVKYQVTSGFSVRAGRIVLPTFMAADTRLVGYVNPWVRPPPEVYGLVPITNSDGVDASYIVHTGSVMHRLVGTLGSGNRQIPNAGSAHSGHFWLIGDNMEYGAATFHAAYQEGRVSFSTLGDFINQFQQFGAQGEALAGKYGLSDKLLTVVSLGAMYDPGRWFAMAEWGLANFHSALGKKSGWYVSGGYRLAKLTPYLSYARANADNLSDPGLTVSALPPQLQAPGSTLNMALNSVLSTKPVQTTVSVGARWDFRKDTDLKLQIDRTFVGSGSNGASINVQPGFQQGGNLSVISATMDFVF